MTVTNCGFSANGDSAIAFFGNGNYLRVRRSEFYDNKAGYIGGAIFFDDGGKENVADVAESLFARNFAKTYGGAISAGSGNTLQVRNCSFYDNWVIATGSAGGAIKQSDPVRLVVFASDFRNNTAGSGGGEH